MKLSDSQLMLLEQITYTYTFSILLYFFNIYYYILFYHLRNYDII